MICEYSYTSRYPNNTSIDAIYLGDEIGEVVLENPDEYFIQSYSGVFILGIYMIIK